ncbi:MAG: hypothetical protein EHM58_12050 [Ignavibacteriae bacterium]|nr:MAG: hypothetical protein EHM58_12050 [Ignavibacteriota bacterium]
MTLIYLDENLSEYVADALNSLNKGYFEDFMVMSTKEKFGKGAKDEIIIPEIGKEKSILITKDFRIQRDNLQNELYKKHRLGFFSQYTKKSSQTLGNGKTTYK